MIFVSMMTEHNVWPRCVQFREIKKRKKRDAELCWCEFQNFKLLAEKYYSKGAGHQGDVLSNCLSYFWSITKYNPLWLLTLKWVWVVPWLWHMNMDLTFIFVHAYLLDSQRAHQTALVCVSCAVLCSGVCMTLEITKSMYSDSYSIKV